MFADSFCDSDWANHSHRRWTTLVSFAAQAVVVGCLLLLPMVYTQGLPKLAVLAPLLAPAPLPMVHSPTTSHLRPAATFQGYTGLRLVSPVRVPESIEMLTDVAPSMPMVDASAIGISHGMGDRAGSVFDAIPGSVQVLPPPPPAVRRPPMSRMMEGNLILRIQPDYPSLARQVRVQGQVVLRAIISREGTIENLQVLSGHPMLVRAAVDAVRRWRYRPYVLNGEPVEVETEVTVNFVLSGG